jgi:hypothetical protein
MSTADSQLSNIGGQKLKRGKAPPIWRFSAYARLPKAHDLPANLPQLGRGTRTYGLSGWSFANGWIVATSIVVESTWCISSLIKMSLCCLSGSRPKGGEARLPVVLESCHWGRPLNR